MEVDVGSCFYYCEPRVCVFGPLGYKFAEGRDFSVLTAGSPSQAHSRLSINICRVHISGMLVGKQCANIFVNCQRAHSFTRERETEKAREKAPPNGTTIPSPLSLHPVGILGMHAYTTGVFFKRLNLGLQPHSQPWEIWLF